MPLRVGFDLDGTVADMSFALRREALELFGEEVLKTTISKSPNSIVMSRPSVSAAALPEKPESTATDGPLTPVPTEDDEPGSDQAVPELQLTARQQMQLWDHVKKYENFWNTLPELEPGIISRIAKTSRERRWEVIFLTTRPSTAGDLVQLQSQRWLELHGFQYPSVFVVHRSRGRIADALALDAFVDDRPENCLDIAVESKAKVILVWHGEIADAPAGAKRLGVQPVSTISEALGLLERLDDVRKQPRLIRSIKRVFGRGE